MRRSQVKRLSAVHIRTNRALNVPRVSHLTEHGSVRTNFDSLWTGRCPQSAKPYQTLGRGNVSQCLPQSDRERIFVPLCPFYLLASGLGLVLLICYWSPSHELPNCRSIDSTNSNFAPTPRHRNTYCVSEFPHPPLHGDREKSGIYTQSYSVSPTFTSGINWIGWEPD